jgi:hypothetical protein
MDFQMQDELRRVHEDVAESVATTLDEHERGIRNLVDSLDMRIETIMDSRKAYGIPGIHARRADLEKLMEDHDELVDTVNAVASGFKKLLKLTQHLHKVVDELCLANDLEPEPLKIDWTDTD